jgi:adenylate kinase
MKIVLIGIQGAGKSTQGNRISEKYAIPYLSSGHIFREMSKEKTPWGRYVKETLNAGVLMPDDKTVDVVNEYLSKPEYTKGYVLDGFPRTLNQAKMFSNGIDNVIYLKVSDKEAVWRLFGRIDEEIRQDNTLDAIRKRISLFHEFTEPVIEFYRSEKKLIEIDGEKDIEDIFAQITKILDTLK